MKTRKIFILATLALHAPCIKSQNLSDDNIRQFLTRFIRQYPQATLQDIYKGAFQDRFGPAHILTDRNAVEAYIKSELEEMGKEELADVRNSDVSHSTKSSRSVWNYCQPCGWRANFYRVDLAIIKDGVMPMDVFVDAFMESANGIDTTLTSAWVEEWDKTLHVIHETVPDLEGFSTDSASIAQLLSSGKYVVHHSHRFNKVYHPHYRIIRKDVLERIDEDCKLRSK